MKITIKEKEAPVLSLKPEHKQKYKTVTSDIEIPDKLLFKAIAVIDELLDRTYDDLENIAFDSLQFPLIPFPFFNKYRDPDNVGVDDYWMDEWLDTTLSNNIIERYEILKLLNKLDAVFIERNPIVNINTGHFEGENFDLKIDRKKLLEYREKLIEGYKKLKSETSDKFNKKQTSTSKEKVIIKNVRLDEEGHFLEINRGDIIIPFRSKKRGKEQGNETKLFKLLYPLFEKKWHQKKDKITKKGDYLSTESLLTLTGCASKEALKQQIKRLNGRFKQDLIPISVKCAGRSCRLIVDFTENKVS